MTSRYLILLAFIAFTACKQKNKLSLILQREVSFNFPGYSGVPLSGTLITDSEELVYFGNVETTKRIDFFRSDGAKIVSVPLSEMQRKRMHIEAIYVQALDTIVLKSAYDNVIYFIDRKGAVWKTVRVPTSFDDNTSFEATASLAASTFMNESEITLHCAPAAPNKPGISNKESLSIQAAQIREKPYFITTENVYDSVLTWRFVSSGFYSRFIPASRLSIEPSMYSISDRGICLFSVYSDTLYLMGKRSNGIEQVVEIKSEYTNIGAQPLVIHSDISDSINLIAQTTGLIINVTYDPYRELYYASVRHQVSAQSSKKGRANFSPWSLILLDKQFNFLGEINMERGKYNPGDLFVVREGLLIHRNNEELPSTSVKFDLFHVKNN